MNDYQILFALMKGARRPGDVNQFDGFSIKGRELVKRCWDYEPGSRPRCEEIYETVVDQVGERDDLEVQDVAVWKAVRGGSGMSVDYVHAHHIVRGIRGTHEYPHHFTPSICPTPTTPKLALNTSDAFIHNPPGGCVFATCSSVPVH